MFKSLIFTLLIYFLLGSTVFACGHPPHTIVRDDFKKIYDQYKVEGAFVLYNPHKGEYVIYNQKLVNQSFIPASTFKICNSLIGLETRVIEDENFIIKWDSILRQYPKWNTDQNLETAFKNSTVWYYQELARRVGGDKMKYWLDKCKYGNSDTSGGIDKFWLTGGLRISPLEQISFLQQLHDNQLPFSQHSMDIVKNIMIMKDTLNYTLRAKSGWGEQGKTNIGWYIGYLEHKGEVYYFANCIQSLDIEPANFLNARLNIVFQILENLKLIDDKELFLFN